MKRYELIEHTADIAIRAYGETLEEAFAEAANAMFDLITGGGDIEAREEKAFDIDAIDEEGLLVNFLSHLIVIHEVERLVLKDFVVTFTGNHGLHARAHGERFDPARHGSGVSIKGVSYHMMEITAPKEGTPASVQVLFDV